MTQDGIETTTVDELRIFQERAPGDTIRRVVRQRLIAEQLEHAAEEAAVDGREGQAHELREQAAEARRVATEVIRTTVLATV
ncbi:MAG: hypothetical protein ACYTGN_06705 [Planctomycetota bacterium]